VKRLAALALGCLLVASACRGGSNRNQELEKLQEREQTKAVQQAEANSPPAATLRPAPEGIWISREEVRRLPMVGPAWDQLKAAADGPLGEADIANQDSDHDVLTMAVALVYARTGDESYRKKAAAAIESAIGTEQGGSTLSLGRNLLSYVIAADLIDLGNFDPSADGLFRQWLERVRTEKLTSKAVPEQTLIGTAERAMNNWGGMAGASRAAIAAYLGDATDLARAAKVMKGWLGDRSAYPAIPGPLFGPGDVGKGFRAGGYDDDLSWQADPARPQGVNPPGAQKEGHSIDGALPEDMRRGGSFRWPPVYTQYPREALSGYVALAELLYRQGYDVYAWSDKALLRATRFLYDLGRRFPDQGWWEPEVRAYWIINYRYGTSFPVEVGNTIGRNFGWTDWTHAAR